MSDLPCSGFQDNLFVPIDLTATAAMSDEMVMNLAAEFDAEELFADIATSTMDAPVSHDAFGGVMPPSPPILSDSEDFDALFSLPTPLFDAPMSNDENVDAFAGPTLSTESGHYSFRPGLRPACEKWNQPK
jgi:hypothetical protein